MALPNELIVFPTLFAKDKKDVLLEWDIRVLGDTITVSYGKVGGKKTLRDTICQGKNIGRSNETTSEEQALAEATALWRKQQDRKGYVQDISQYGAVFFPMLAKDYKNNEAAYERAVKKEGYPICVAQPKLNGIRSFYENGVFYSRKRKIYANMQGKYWKLDEVVQKYASIMACEPENVILDGEFYIHEELIQNIQSIVKVGTEKQVKETNLRYCLFDVYVKNKPSLSFTQRFLPLPTLYEDTVPYIYCTGLQQEEMWKIVESLEGHGFEGAMWRLDKPYQHGTRSSYLWKAKNFVDEEYLIVGVVEKKPITTNGKDIRQAIFTCSTPDGEQFECRMRGEDAVREHIALHPQEYIGKMVNVRFQEKSERGAPIFPVGIYVRDEE